MNQTKKVAFLTLGCKTNQYETNGMMQKFIEAGYEICNLEENPDTSVLFITHYTRILNYVKPTHVHMMNNGTIVKSGNFDLALEIEKNGYNE